MKVYLDSSALAKRFIEEPGTQEVAQICSQATEICLSPLCLLELISCLNRKRREKKIEKSLYIKIKKDLIQDIEQATLIEIDSEILSRTILCLETTLAKTLDSIHLASALYVKSDLFVTADKKQFTAAKILAIQSRLVE